jgi:hypothetical protein
VSIVGRIREVGPFIDVTGYDDSLDLFDALLAFYLSRRPRRVTAWGSICPETTVADVLMVRGQLAQRLVAAQPDRLGLAATKTRWQMAETDLERHRTGKLLHEIYPDNATFWREARKLAVDLSSISALPAKTKIVVDALASSVGSVTSLGSDVLDAGERLLSGAAEAGLDAVKAIGSGAKDVVKGTVEGVGDALVKPLVDVVGKPLLIGAAVVGGLLIVPKLFDGDRRAA